VPTVPTDPTTTDAPRRPASRVSVTTGQAQIAGAVAAGMALAVGEVVTGMGGNGQSLVGSVGSAFIDQAGGDVARTAIDIFNTGDKPALVIGIVIISLLLGALLGSWSRRRPWVGPLGFAAFGVVGIVASARDDLASTGLAVVESVLAVLAGSATLWALLRVAATGHLVPTTGPARAVRPDRPTDPHASRRAFFGYAGAAGAFALVAGTAGARSLRGRSTVVDDARAQIQLPAPTNTAVPPSAPAAMQGPGVASFPVDGLTPYIIPADRFYRIDTALTVPQVNVDTWSMKVSGMVDNPFELTFADLLAMPRCRKRSPCRACRTRSAAISSATRSGRVSRSGRCSTGPASRAAPPRSWAGRSTGSPPASPPPPSTTDAPRWSPSA